LLKQQYVEELCEHQDRTKAFEKENMLSKGECNVLEDFIKYSKQIANMTVRTQSEVSLSMVLPLLLTVWKDLCRLSTHADSSAFLKSQSKLLTQELTDIFHPINVHYVLASFADIRYKDMAFARGFCTVEDAAQMAIVYMTTILEKESEKDDKVEEYGPEEQKHVLVVAENEEEDGQPPPKKQKHIAHFDALEVEMAEYRAEAKKKRDEEEKEKERKKRELIAVMRTPKQRSEEAVKKWVQVPYHERSDGDPYGLNYWKEEGINDHPLFWELIARGYLGCPAGNASSERLFNVLGDIDDKKRNGLGESSRNNLIIINQNAAYFYDEIVSFGKKANE